MRSSFALVLYIRCRRCRRLRRRHICIIFFLWLLKKHSQPFDYVLFFRFRSFTPVHISTHCLLLFLFYVHAVCVLYWLQYVCTVCLQKQINKINKNTNTAHWKSGATFWSGFSFIFKKCPHMCVLLWQYSFFTTISSFLRHFILNHVNCNCKINSSNGNMNSNIESIRFQFQIGRQTQRKRKHTEMWERNAINIYDQFDSNQNTHCQSKQKTHALTRTQRYTHLLSHIFDRINWKKWHVYTKKKQRPHEMCPKHLLCIANRLPKCFTRFCIEQFGVEYPYHHFQCVTMSRQDYSI